MQRYTFGPKDEPENPKKPDKNDIKISIDPKSIEKINFPTYLRGMKLDSTMPSTNAPSIINSGHTRCEPFTGLSTIQEEIYQTTSNFTEDILTNKLFTNNYEYNLKNAVAVRIDNSINLLDTLRTSHLNSKLSVNAIDGNNNVSPLFVCQKNENCCNEFYTVNIVNAYNFETQNYMKIYKRNLFSSSKISAHFSDNELLGCVNYLWEGKDFHIRNNKHMVKYKIFKQHFTLFDDVFKVEGCIKDISSNEKVASFKQIVSDSEQISGVINWEIHFLRSLENDEKLLFVVAGVFLADKYKIIINNLNN